MLLLVLQNGAPPMEDIIPIVIIVVSILGDILIFKIGLAISKAEIKKGLKWVAISFLIQFGAVFFISSPIMLMGIAGAMDGPPDVGLIVTIIIFSVFIDFNLINIIHKIGMKKSIVIGIIIFIPMFFAMYFLGNFVATLPQTY